MAEGVLEGVLGGEAEEREADAPLSGADAIATAVAMDAARHDPELSRKAGDYLDEQRALVKLQAKHFEAERELALEAARRKRFSDRLRNGFQTLLALIVALVIAGLGMMIWNAATSRAVVVEPFEVAPALAARGLNGTVAASTVMDGLSHIQGAIRTDQAQRRVSAAWAGDIKVEVPETGVSIGELGLLLRERLGHDILIGGDLVQGPDGRLSLTVRGDGIAARTFSGTADAFPALADQAAEYLFGSAEPREFIRYLGYRGRTEEAKTFAAANYFKAKPGERADWLAAWGRTFYPTDLAKAEALWRAAIATTPTNWSAWNNLVALMRDHGREEEAQRTYLQAQRLGATAPARDRPTPRNLLTGTRLTQDWPAYVAAVRSSAAFADGQGLQTITSPVLFSAGYTELHDWNTAQTGLLESPPDATGVALAGDILEGRRGLEEGRIAEAVAALAKGQAQIDLVTVEGFPTNHCWLGLAYDLAGRPAEAAKAYEGPLMVACESFRADGLEFRGDRAGADAAYAHAVAVAPSLPFAYHRWGLALLARGDLAGAARKFAAASARGPHWADPLKGAGDVLAREGRWAEALATYQKGLIYAPAWAALLQARDLAARRAHRS